MRNFWIAIGLLGVLAAWLVWPSDRSDLSDGSDRSDLSDTSDPSDTSDGSDPSDPSDRSDLSDLSDASDRSDTSDLSDTSDPSDQSDASDMSDPSDPSDQSDQSDQSDASDPSDQSDASDLSDLSDTSDGLTLGLDREIPDATIVSGRIVRSESGTLLADDRYEIAGAGTEEDPYRVSWELLVSAGEGYRPRVGDRGMPQRVALLDGAWIEIEGYIAFPMLVGTATEGLVMLNRWDGCCIGVPPSPYDAIEVKLANPVVRTRMHAIDYGTVTGKLSVSPYLVENWLVGLYLMDDATMKIDL